MKMGGIIACVIGAAIGAAGGYFVATSIANKKIAANDEETRKFYKEKYKDYEKKSEEIDKEFETLIEEMHKEREDYVNIVEELHLNPANENANIEIIRPEDFAENDYNTRSILLYADGVFTNDENEVLEKEEVETLIGDAAEHFGEYGIDPSTDRPYDEDTVYIRNNVTQTDYELIRYYTNYVEG